MTPSDHQPAADLHPRQRLSPAPQVRFRELGGEGVLLDLERGLYFRLNETGVAIWKGLAAGMSLGELRAKLQVEFAVEPDQVWRDLVALVQTLRAESLILSDARDSD